MIKKLKFSVIICALLISSMILTACGASQTPQGSSSSAATSTATSSSTTEASSSSTESKITLKDGSYTAKFTTDSSMFHVNEAKDDLGELTVKDGIATIHVTLASKNVIKLFAGLAEDAKLDGAPLLLPTTDSVKYSDGTTDEVYGFDIPVPVIDEEFDVALMGTKEKWYDHKVKVSEVTEKK